jgi:hypothetical protein
VNLEATSSYRTSIFDPGSQSISQSRISTARSEFIPANNLKNGTRRISGNRGKAGVRRKIFRIDEPISRDGFSLISQAFFVWNRDPTTYFALTFKQAMFPRPMERSTGAARVA